MDKKARLVFARPEAVKYLGALFPSPQMDAAKDKYCGAVLSFPQMNDAKNGFQDDLMEQAGYVRQDDSPLLNAIRRGYEDLALELLSSNASFRVYKSEPLPYADRVYLETPLSLAICGRSERVVKALLESRADPNESTGFEFSHLGSQQLPF